jgi:hypothetical protein
MSVRPVSLIRELIETPIILETAVEDDKLMQFFELESLLMGAPSPFGNDHPHRKRL